MTKNVGGARRTTHINRRVTQSGFRAFDYAAETGRPLNTYVVLHLKESVRASAATIFERVRHKFRDWLTYRSKQLGSRISPIYVYTLENPNDAPHVNWVLHVPSALRVEFERKLERWVTKVQGPCDEFTCDCQDVARNAKSLAKYIFKGTDPAFVDHFHLQKVHAPQGIVYGKRAGVSPSIGHASRRAVNYRPRRHQRATSSAAASHVIC